MVNIPLKRPLPLNITGGQYHGRGGGGRSNTNLPRWGGGHRKPSKDGGYGDFYLLTLPQADLVDEGSKFFWLASVNLACTSLLPIVVSIEGVLLSFFVH